MNQVELDPILRDFGWNAERLSMVLANRDRPFKMNRRERMIFRLEREILESKRWAKMKEKVELGTPTRDDPQLRLVKCVKVKAMFAARAGPFLEVNDLGYRRTGKSLRALIAHEMIHYYLQDNKTHAGTRKVAYMENDYHGRLFRECAAVLIHSRENPTVYRYSCPCGRWIQIPGKRRTELRCSCGKRLVSKPEFDRLRKIAALGSKLHPVEISRYAVMTVKRKA